MQVVSGVEVGLPSALPCVPAVAVDTVQALPHDRSIAPLPHLQHGARGGGEERGSPGMLAIPYHNVCMRVRARVEMAAVPVALQVTAPPVSKSATTGGACHAGPRGAVPRVRVACEAAAAAALRAMACTSALLLPLSLLLAAAAAASAAA